MSVSIVEICTLVHLETSRSSLEVNGVLDLLTLQEDAFPISKQVLLHFQEGKVSELRLERGFIHVYVLVLHLVQVKPRVYVVCLDQLADSIFLELLLFELSVRLLCLDNFSLNLTLS